jgi:hypothetical protein
MYDDGVDDAPARRGGKMWVECRNCRATMYSTFDTCWCCGSRMDEKNSSALRF